MKAPKGHFFYDPKVVMYGLSNEPSKSVKLFFQAFLQVFLVCLNTFFIAKDNLVGILFCSFLISYIWAGNVKKISTSTQTDRIVYSFGAMTGGAAGYLFGKLLYLWF